MGSEGCWGEKHVWSLSAHRQLAAAEAKGALKHNQEPSPLILLFTLSREIDTP